MKKNEDIRIKSKESKIMLWQIAERLGITDGNFSKKLRKEFSPGEKALVFEIIQSLNMEREEEEIWTKEKK